MEYSNWNKISYILSEMLLKEEGLSVTDLSGKSRMKGKGKPLKNDKYFVIHHTGGDSSAEGVIDVLNSRMGGLGVQFIIDKNGKIGRAHV